MNVYNNEKMEEECGVFAMYSPVLRSDLAPLTYYGLYALQHRGQESAGMTLCDSFGENRVRHCKKIRQHFHLIKLENICQKW